MSQSGPSPALSCSPLAAASSARAASCVASCLFGCPRRTIGITLLTRSSSILVEHSIRVQWSNHPLSIHPLCKSLRNSPPSQGTTSAALCDHRRCFSQRTTITKQFKIWIPTSRMRGFNDCFNLADSTNRRRSSSSKLGQITTRLRSKTLKSSDSHHKTTHSSPTTEYTAVWSRQASSHLVSSRMPMRILTTHQFTVASRPKDPWT